MALSSHGRVFDVRPVGIGREDLPHFSAGVIDLRSWFDAARRDRQMDLEIGSGKGTFLVQQAAQTPEVNYIGIEYAAAVWRYAADRCRRHGLENVRLVHTEAESFVRNHVADGLFRQVHIYFPDPWPKKRHNKRRLVQAPFLRELWRTLVDPCSSGDGAEGKPVDASAEGGRDAEAGQIRLATDHSDYFEWMLEHAGQVADLFEQRPFVSPHSAGEGELVGTNFERKYRREGRPFHAMILRKRVSAV